MADERIIEVAERVEALPEAERQAALNSLSGEDRAEVLVQLAVHSGLVTRFLEEAIAPLPAEAGGIGPDDPQYEAEARMAAQLADTYSQAVWRLLRQARGQGMTESEIEAAAGRLTDEDPELAESFAVYLRFYEPG
ncbi:MAG TPA: hypothetical protein VKG82_04530 [Solirubrobacteraceae bacterium]|nr:hypothetical protein [Solirubrobacteraceae bacterium]